MTTDMKTSQTMTRNWHCYAIRPVDSGWEYLPTVRQVASQIERKLLGENENKDSWDNPQPILNFMTDFNRALDLGKRKGWSGKFMEDSRVMWLPGIGAFNYAFVWKHDRQGTTFVVSPHPLEWLTDLEV